MKVSQFSKTIYSIILILFLILITVLTLNSNLRRNLMFKAIGGYNMYNYLIIRGDIKRRDFASVSNKIINYIEFSQKISKGKNRMFQGIYDITAQASSKIYTQKELDQMEKVYVELDKITQDLYMNHVWLAKVLKNKDTEKAIYHLNKALNLVSSNEYAYRELIRIYNLDNSMNTLIKKYCENYFIEYEGSLNSRNYSNLFIDNQKFSIIINDDFEKTYTKNLENLENSINYVFDFEDLKNIKKITIIHNFFSGSKIIIEDIILENDLLQNIELSNLNYDSNSNYVLESNNKKIVFLSTNDEDQLINFYFSKEYLDVSKITIKINLKKLDLTKTSLCSN